MSKYEEVIAGSKESMDAVISNLKNQLFEARKKGPEHATLILTTAAFTLGTLIPVSVEERSFGPLHMGLIEAMGSGIQTGMKLVGAKGSMEMTVVRKDL